MNHSIIVIDDETVFLKTVRRGLFAAGFKNVRTESDPEKAALLFQQGTHFDIALIDIRMPLTDGMKLLEIIKNTEPDTECIMITAVNELRIAVECMKKGAYDYLVKPFSKEELVLILLRAIEKRQLRDIADLYKNTAMPKLQYPEIFKSIITRCPRMLRILKEAELHAASNIPILITGESGTGKELLAKAVHSASDRADFPCTVINMASYTPTLFDAEFFGYVRGAFTGAEKDRSGYLDHTNKGTLVLDEIGVLPYELQGKLLRVLQEGEYFKIGTNSPRKADIRFIALTNENPEQMVQEGKFRKDLYYRLRGAWLHMPPLRERTEDIPLLIRKFLKAFCGDNKPPGIDEDVRQIFMSYHYPGNIRELKHMIQTAVNLSQGNIISRDHLPHHMQYVQPLPEDKQTVSGEMASLAEAEKVHIARIYHQTGKNKTKTARYLGIALNTLRKKLKLYHIS